MGLGDGGEVDQELGGEVEFRARITKFTVQDQQVTLVLKGGASTYLLGRLNELQVAETLQVNLSDPQLRMVPEMVTGSDGSVYPAAAPDGRPLLHPEEPEPARRGGRGRGQEARPA